MATARRKTKPSVISNPTLTQRREQARTSPSFVTCQAKDRIKGCTGKASQPVIARIKHMHREHCAYFGPTCALRAPLVSHTFDSLFYLCRARMMRTQTPNERSGDNPSVWTKLTTRTQCICVA